MIAMIPITMTRKGKALKVSTIRMITASTIPPK